MKKKTQRPDLDANRIPEILKEHAIEHVDDGYKIVDFIDGRLVLSKRIRLKIWKLVLGLFLGIYGFSPLLIYQDFVGMRCYVYLELCGEEVVLTTD